MLTKDMRLLKQRQRTLSLTALVVTKVLTFSQVSALSLISTGYYEVGPSNTYKQWFTLQERNPRLREPNGRKPTSSLEGGIICTLEDSK